MNSSNAPLTTDPAFGKLGRAIGRFANHTRRHLHSSRKHRVILEKIAQWSANQAPISQTPFDPKTALSMIDEYAKIHNEQRLTLLGAYFAHHHLRIQAEMSRELLRENIYAAAGQRLQTCWRIYRSAEKIRRAWIASLLELCIKIAAPSVSEKNYVALNTGALTDHEDVDLAIVAADPLTREELSKNFGLVSKIFVQYASKFQLFLTEELATPRICALVSEYAKLKEHPTRNVVSVMQLLGAQYLCGSRELFEQLQQDVINPYYAGQGEPVVHEGFLRSVMAELKFFLIPETTPGVLAPKREIYVPIKLATSAMRVIHGIREPLAALALETLADVDTTHRTTYISLANVFVQVEVLRSLIYLYVYAKDELDLQDHDVQKPSQHVALLLGFKDSARRSSAHRLIGAYTDLREKGLSGVATLSADISDRLEKVSTFRQLISRVNILASRNSVHSFPISLLNALEQHHGSIFWDEIIKLIRNDKDTQKRFVDDLHSLNKELRENTTRRYLKFMIDQTTSLVEFLVFLSQTNESSDSASIAWEEFFTQIRSSDYLLNTFIQQLDTETSSALLFELTKAYPSKNIAQLADLIEERDQSPRGARVTRTLRSILILVYHRSNAVGRVADRILHKNRDFLGRVNDYHRLKLLSQNLYKQASIQPNLDTQIRLLQEACDVAYLRGVIYTILRASPVQQDHELVSTIDQFIRELFKAYFREFKRKSPIFKHYRPGANIAIYATGGYGRQEAFGSDFDYFAIISGDDPGLGKFLGKVLQRVSTSMTRCGLQPHNRFADIFNSYVVHINDLASHLTHRTNDLFIDEAEVLEGRFFLGDPILASQFESRIRNYVLTDNRTVFIKDILKEIKDRKTFQPPTLNVKQSSGGLRDIHLLWLALQTYLGAKEPLSYTNTQNISGKLEGTAEDLQLLCLAHHELRKARDIYRLVVAFDDAMDTNRFAEISKDIKPLVNAGFKDNYKDFLEELLSSTSQRIDNISQLILNNL